MSFTGQFAFLVMILMCYASAAQKPPCRTQQLELATARKLSVGGGRVTTDYIVINRGSATCHLRGYPGAKALGPDRRVVPEISFEQMGGTTYGGQQLVTVVLNPGGKAWFQIETADGTGLDDTTLCYKARWVQMTPPDNLRAFRKTPEFRSCAVAQISYFVKGVPPE